MKRVKYLSSFFIAFILGVYVMSNFADFDLANSISNRKDEKDNYFQDESGTFWNSKEDYLKYNKDGYFVAPDGTFWENEYRYEESLKAKDI